MRIVSILFALLIPFQAYSFEIVNHDEIKAGHLAADFLDNSFIKSDFDKGFLQLHGEFKKQLPKDKYVEMFSQMASVAGIIEIEAVSFEFLGTSNNLAIYLAAGTNRDTTGYIRVVMYGKGDDYKVVGFKTIESLPVFDHDMSGSYREAGISIVRSVPYDEIAEKTRIASAWEYLTKSAAASQWAIVSIEGSKGYVQCQRIEDYLECPFPVWVKLLPISGTYSPVSGQATPYPELEGSQLREYLKANQVDALIELLTEENLEFTEVYTRLVDSNEDPAGTGYEVILFLDLNYQNFEKLVRNFLDSAWQARRTGKYLIETDSRD